jgi:hypothetical protein
MIPWDLGDDDHRIRPKIRGSLLQFLIHRRLASAGAHKVKR